MKKTLITTLCLLCSFLSFAQPYIASHTVLENNGKLNKLEIGFEIPGQFALGNANYINPYDWDKVRLEVELLGPGTNINSFGFYYHDFQIDANPTYNSPCNPSYSGTPNCPPPGQMKFTTQIYTDYNFRVRFAPPCVWLV